MKLLSIGYALPNPSIDNYNVLTAPSYFDYDALFIDPASITTTARQMLEDGYQYEAFDGRQVVNAPTTGSVVSAADQIRRRADETARLLEAGGVVIVLLRPNLVQPGLLGFEGCDRYSWLPAPAGLSWSHPFVRTAEGKIVRVTDDAHPFAPVLREFRSDISYRAYFDERQPAFRQAAQSIAVGGGGVVLSAEFRHGSGRILFLPAMNDGAGHSRPDMAQSIMDAAALLLNATDDRPAPYWTQTLAVPGLEQLEAELEEARTTKEEAAGREAAVRERVDALTAHRRLLFDDGPSFAAAVADALRLIGFAVTSEVGGPLVAEAEGEQIYIEVESSREQVVEWPYIRLQRRLEERLLTRADQLKGLIIANGQRDSQPEYRTDDLSTPLQIACQNYRYSLITGPSLFALVQRALGGADEDALGGIRRRIIRANGLLSREAALGEVAEDKETGPIF